MMMKIEAPYFQWLYVCLDASKKSFLAGCRPIVCVDGYHLKNTFQGQLLMASQSQNAYAFSGLRQTGNFAPWKPLGKAATKKQGMAIPNKEKT
ncbi:hypothetical protein L3X38_032533 [Prunus dulcis]|uniref:Uncharacterized protein n=1 Tax=Prunus dulcis TaxID=3755 RepID=A0AAD4VGF0_PRUDU|nr:hypothetical protein L3X38_032533 [Prunus dulcis]